MSSGPYSGAATEPREESSDDQHALLGSRLRRPAGGGPRDRGRRPRRARPAAQRPAADRERELHLAGGARRARLDADATSTPRATPAGATTAAAPIVDQAENIGIERAKELFGADHANLQPHSGASANLAAYAAFLQARRHGAGDGLPHGGHLTHGSKVNFSGKWFNTVSYGVPRGHRAHRLRPGPRPGPGAPAEDDHLRRHGLPAADRLRRLPGDRRRGRRHPHGRRRALHRPGRRQGDPVARCRTRTSSASPRTRCCAARAAA